VNATLEYDCGRLVAKEEGLSQLGIHEWPAEVAECYQSVHSEKVGRLGQECPSHTRQFS